MSPIKYIFSAKSPNNLILIEIFEEKYERKKMIKNKK